MIRIGDEIKQKYYKTANAEVKTLKEFIYIFLLIPRSLFNWLIY